MKKRADAATPLYGFVETNKLLSLHYGFSSRAQPSEAAIFSSHRSAVSTLILWCLEEMQNGFSMPVVGGISKPLHTSIARNAQSPFLMRIKKGGRVVMIHVASTRYDKNAGFARKHYTSRPSPIPEQTDKEMQQAVATVCCYHLSPARCSM